jgi:hypothetical protein
MIFWDKILVGGRVTPLKNMSSSVGTIIPNIWKVIKFMFQTTNQDWYWVTRIGFPPATSTLVIFLDG